MAASVPLPHTSTPGTTSATKDEDEGDLAGIGMLSNPAKAK
jgi:hypothetical protein